MSQTTKDVVKINKFKNFLITKGVLITLIIFATIASGFGGYYFFQYQKSKESLANPAVLGETEVRKLVDEVGNAVELPKDEVPTVATVSDVTKLKGQAFFAQAQNGDKVLIYQKAKKAILYRPSIKKIIEFGPINVGADEEASATASANISPTPAIIRVVLRNGTTTAGLASTVEKDLKSKVSNITVVAKDNAAKQDYKKTVVVDLSGGNSQGTQQLAQFVGGEIGKLPEGEEAPADADILVILGR